MHLFPKSRWQHFKGAYYIVIDIAYDTERDKSVVIYRDEKYGRVYCRTVDGWFQEVAVPNGTIPRFTFVGE